MGSVSRAVDRSSAPVIFLSAGEASGDAHGAALARALRARLPGVRLIGLGGERMADAGVELLASLDRLAVMGMTEVIRHLPYFVGLRRRVFGALEREGVGLVVPIDYPGFNLRLARHARGLGVPVLYYIAPQVWAWHASRTAALARDADRVAVILPFEESFLRARGVPATFVGHPLLDRSASPKAADEWVTEQGLDPSRPVLGLFPGSRAQEIARHLALFSETASRVRESSPDVQPLIAAAPHLDPSIYAGVPWPRSTDGQELLRHARAALVKSGTTTLEAALAPVPFVVAYRMSPLTFRAAKRLVKVPHIALANLVADDRVVPEFVQNDATPDRLAAALLPLLDSGSPARDEMLRGLDRIRSQLGEAGAAARVAETAAALIGVTG